MALAAGRQNDEQQQERLQPDRRLDLRGTLCPVNFVKTKLALEEMNPGQLLEVIVDDGEPIANIPRSVKAEGHQIVEVEKESDGFRLTIRVAG